MGSTCACARFHVLFSGVLVLMVHSPVARASAYMHAHLAKELLPYFRIRCELKCPYGYETDIEGSFVCLCHDPCQNVRCFNRTRCVVQLPKACHRDYCRPTATCKEISVVGHSPSLRHGIFQADDATTTSSETSLPDKCWLPVTDEAKQCRKPRMRWYFDDVTATCKSFIGCKTKGNNFRGKRGCERTCVSASVSRSRPRRPATAVRDVSRTSGGPPAGQTTKACQLPVLPVSKGCRRARRRWFYDSKSGRCRKFRGCPGGGNNFSKRRQCKRRCMAATSSKRRKGRRHSSRSAKH